MKKSQITGAILSILVVIGMFFVPESIGLERAGICTLGLMIAMIIALVTEPLPIGLICMLGVPLMVVFKIYPSISGALSGYTNHILFFVLVSFGISESMAKVPISKRILAKMIDLFGAKSERILLAVMLCAASLSSIMSNVATTALLITVVLNFLNVYEKEEERKRSGKAFMIGLPIASMIGGMITPAGSPLNILGLDFLTSYAGINVSFVQWMLIGTPIAVVMIFFSWFLIIKVFKLPAIEEEKTRQYVESLEIPETIDYQEKYVILVVGIMFVLWILSSWFPALAVTVVGTIGFAFLFVPKYGVLDWKEYCGHVSWESFFLIGTMMSMGSALSTNGVSSWIVDLLFSGTMSFSLPVMIFILSIVIFLLLLPIPIGPALISMLAIPFIDLGSKWGISPVAMIMTLTLCAANCYLLPLDTVPLLTYSTGYYKMTDMPKVSVLIQLVLAVVTAIWIPASLAILGIV